VRIGVVALVANMALNVAIVVPWVRTGVAAPHTGLAIATAASGFLNAGLLARALRRQGVLHPRAGWPRYLVQIVVACAVMGALLVNFTPSTVAWLETDVWTRCAWLAAAVIGGVVAYVAALLAVGVRPAALRMQTPGRSPGQSPGPRL
jgi:putative peptidoglycan lipid II flippase